MGIIYLLVKGSNKQEALTNQNIEAPNEGAQSFLSTE